jgi:chitinase
MGAAAGAARPAAGAPGGAAGGRVVALTGASVSIRHADVRAICHRYPDRSPILVVTAGGADITITADRDTESVSVDELVRAVEQYSAALTDWQQQRQACRCERSAVTR